MSRTDTDAAPPSSLGSLGKGLALIEVLASAGHSGLALREIVDRSGINKASVHRLLQALVHLGWASQDPRDRRYRLGTRPGELLVSFHGDENLPALFRPLLAEVSRAVGETVHLGTLLSDSVLYLDKVEPDRAIRVGSRIGRQVPAVSTALGRAMLAAHDVSDADIDAMSQGAGDVSRRAVAAVRQARVRGFAVEREENETGICCVAVAFGRASGEPVSVSVTGPTFRLDEERMVWIGERLRTIAHDRVPTGFELLPRPRE